jgi:hypothetical protein
LAHQALVRLPEDFIQRQVYTSVNGLKDWDMKQHLLMGSERSFNEALNQALKLEAVNATAGPPAML